MKSASVLIASKRAANVNFHRSYEYLSRLTLSLIHSLFSSVMVIAYDSGRYAVFSCFFVRANDCSKSGEQETEDLKTAPEEARDHL